MLQISDLTLRVAGRPLIEGASVSIPDGAKVGLVGRNGAGKSTLFRAVSGEISPDGGTLSLPKGMRLGRVEQEVPSGPISLIDTVLSADRERTALMAEAETATDPHRISEIHTRLFDIGAHEAESRAARILHGLGFSTEAQQRPCSDFSGGWRMRVALAGVLFSEPDLLLLDEPTNYLDLEGTLWLERYIARYPRTALIISHDRDLLNNAVDSIIHLSDRKLTFWRGGYDQFERQFREQQLLQGKQKAKQDAQRKHMEAFVERFRATASKARQAQSRLKALSKLQPIAEISSDSVLPFRFPDPERKAAPPIIRMENVTVGYEPGKAILSKLNIRIDDDDRIALLGTNGNGKSTFAKLIAGALEPQAGDLTRATKLKIGFFAQHQMESLIPGDSAVDHVRQLMKGSSEAQVRARVSQMGLATQKMDTAARDLSGGEKARLMMGIAAFDSPHLLILDEPTNHLDIDSREALVHALNEYNGAVILISHDRHLLEASADRLWLVANGGVSAYDGDLEDYRRLIISGADGKDSGKSKGSKGSSQQDARREAAEKREQLAPLRKSLKDRETQMERVRKEIAKLDGELADPTLYDRNPHRAAQAAKRRASQVSLLEEIEAEWLEISEQIERAEAELTAA
ncbi:ATP-binding cassette, subfamily F, member 3 [Faunimonas pinastri]|uniref:ATP-binding cassette, subfamily F, member 3 n=1 Tax=Faunimonas pinastri TaxID=1855383 RepID=A0A1H9CZF1_9HYPH|nr:ABC-F family ATP-binding cassette domain-containing protein [Faunimonas pinastri]SEQ06590.1 ATP-binding cassette, subfamily F, member 3 [Faunimonas pinastri]